MSMHPVNSGPKPWNNWPSAWNYFRTFSISVLMKVVRIYQKDCTLCWDVYIICICNVLIWLLCHYRQRVACHICVPEEVKLSSALFLVWNNWPSASKFYRVALSRWSLLIQDRCLQLLAECMQQLDDDMQQLAECMQQLAEFLERLAECLE
jgi:hypothetical protein